MIYTGAAAPDNSLGNVSDIYLAINTGAVYYKVVPAQWVLWPNSGADATARADAAQAIADAAAAQATADAALPSASFTDAAVSAKLLTGLAAGADTPISATDSILVALANLQAQIDALP